MGCETWSQRECVQFVRKAASRAELSDDPIETQRLTVFVAVAEKINQLVRSGKLSSDRAEEIADIVKQAVMENDNG